MKMLFEAGKTYRIRDGREMRVYATDGNADRPIHGSVDGVIFSWLGDGSYLGFQQTHLDILPPRPAKIDLVRWLNVYEHGYSMPEKSADAATAIATCFAIRIAVPVRITEIEDAS